MLLLSSVAEIAGDGPGVPAVVAAQADDGHLVEQACRWLGVPAGAHARVPWDAVRPTAALVGEVVSDKVLLVSLATVRSDASLTPVRALVSRVGVVLVAPDGRVCNALAAVVAHADSPNAGLVALLGEVARTSEDSVGAFADDIQQGWDTRLALLTRLQRREALTTRRALMAVDGIFSAQQQMLDEDGDVVPWLDGEWSRELARARHRFGYISQMASRLYAAAGDELSQQSTLVTEQLTIVNTVFLPLTLGASFFGMNFGWLTGHIESGWSFVLFGVVVPAVLAVATVLAMRRLQRRSVDPDA